MQDSVEWLRGVGLTTPQLRTVLWKYIPVGERGREGAVEVHPRG